MLLIINFLVGFVVILGCLFLIGITRGRGISQKTWVFLWSIVSLIFAIFLIISVIIGGDMLINYSLGGSIGYVTAVSIHTIDHAIEETRKGRKGEVATPTPK